MAAVSIQQARFHQECEIYAKTITLVLAAPNLLCRHNPFIYVGFGGYPIYSVDTTHSFMLVLAGTPIIRQTQPFHLRWFWREPHLFCRHIPFIYAGFGGHSIYSVDTSHSITLVLAGTPFIRETQPFHSHQFWRVPHLFERHNPFIHTGFSGNFSCQLDAALSFGL